MPGIPGGYIPGTWGPSVEAPALVGNAKQFSRTLLSSYSARIGVRSALALHAYQHWALPAFDFHHSSQHCGGM